MTTKILFQEKKSRTEYQRLARFFSKRPDFLGGCCLYLQNVGGWRYIFAANGKTIEEGVKNRDISEGAVTRTVLKEYIAKRIEAARAI